MRADPSAIGARIRQLRLARSPRLTQEQLAERAGVSVDLIGKLEQGQRQTAQLGSLHKLANALGVEVSLLLARPWPAGASGQPTDPATAGSAPMRSPAANPVGAPALNRPALHRLTQEMRRRRRAASLSQRALSQQMAYVREYVTLAERGVRVPSREFIARYAQALGATQVLLPLWEAARAEDEASKRARQQQDARHALVLDQAAAQPINTAAGLLRDAALATIRGRWSSSRPPSPTRLATVGLGLPPTVLGHTRCWVRTRRHGRPLPRWSGPLWTCAPNLATRHTRPPPHCPRWRVR
jgi:transcriptional regulator with XRE-family HTH domain